MRWRVAVAAVLALLVALVAAMPRSLDAQPAIPALTAHVVDTTATLDDARKAALEQKLQGLQARKGSQVAILLVASTSPEPIESYTLRVAERWKVGRKDVDDGALMVVATADHRIRIEVGYGLEGALPDAMVNRIITQVMVPRLRANDLAGAIDAGVDGMIAAIDGEALPAPVAADLDDVPTLPALLPLFLGIVIVAGIALRALLGRLPGALAGGMLAAIAAWWLVGGLAIAMMAGLMATAMILGGGLGFGPLVFGGGSGSGGGGGGFSGGGGRFGGGGASGRW